MHFEFQFPYQHLFWLGGVVVMALDL